MKLCIGNVGVKGSVAYMGQRPFIQNSTLRDNITFGNNNHIMTELYLFLRNYFVSSESRILLKFFLSLSLLLLLFLMMTIIDIVNDVTIITIIIIIII